jgi:predicted nucleotidyltransferase
MSNPAVIDLPERVRDRDIFRDFQNRLFVVLGYIQPSDRVLSYLKYVPADDGMWEAGGIRYRRIFWGSVDSTLEGMAILPQNYTTEDSHFQTPLVEPPREMIREYYSPELRLREILEEPTDTLEVLTKSAAEILHDEFGVAFDSVGVAGSILWKGHNTAHSDINMNIYGFTNAWTLLNNFERVDGFRNQARLRSLLEWKHAIGRVHARIANLRPTDLDALFSRRRALCIGDRCIGITPVLYPEETPIHHGSESYITQTDKPVNFRMVIESTKYGIFHPAVYEIAPIVHNRSEISRIMVYDGAFGGLFEEGDSVEVSGTLQKVVTPKEDADFYQVMVGTKRGSGKEYIRFL